MRGRLAGGPADLRRPAIAAPVEALRGRLVGHPFPPDATVRSQRDIGEDGVPRDGRHGVGVGAVRRAGGHAKHASLRIDCMKATGRVRFDPGDIVPDHRHVPVVHAVGRDQHCQIGLAACAGKCRGDVRLLPLRIFDAENEHVLGHPSLITRDVRRDAQTEALLSQ